MPGSSDPEALALVEWDLDNDGPYGAPDAEPTGASQSPLTGYAAGARTVGVRVTDSDGAQRTATLAFRVNAAPTPRFLIEPLTPVINETTTFSSTSSDPDPEDSASALSYSWTPTATASPTASSARLGLTASRVFPTANMTPGHPVALRVTDTGG